MLHRKQSTERWRNFPPCLISVSALPCKTYNMEITSFYLNIARCFVNKHKICTAERQNVICYMFDRCWHLLSYCKTSLPLTFHVSRKVSHNWRGTRYGECRLCAYQIAGCFVPCLVFFGAYSRSFYKWLGGNFFLPVFNCLDLLAKQHTTCVKKRYYFHVSSFARWCRNTRDRWIMRLCVRIILRIIGDLPHNWANPA